MVFSAIVGMSQTIGEAFYVYRNDGMINTFFRSEIDSIAYSYYDADSLIYDEIVSQVIYTPDSIYQIPLAVIDSVGFVTPETKYQPNVIRLEGEIRNYILGSDSLTVYFRSDTPNNILPKIGDKLVTTEMSDVFEGGFLGQVESIAQTNDTITLKCNIIGLDEVFECFYYSNSYEQTQATSRKRAMSWNGSFSPDPFVFSLAGFLKASIKPVDCPWKVAPKYDVSIAPSFHSKGSIIVHPIKGVVINLDIKQQTAITQDIAMTGSLSVTKPILETGPIPITAIIPFVWVYGECGLFIGTNMKVSMEQHWSQSLSYNIHFEASYLPALAIATSIPKLSINGVNLISEHSGKCLVEGSVRGGVFGEIGIALLEKHVASTGFRFEGGLKLVGNTMIYNSDTQQSLFTTSLYDKLESSDTHLKAFCSVGLDAQLIHVGKANINVFSKEWELTKFKLVPDFSNTTLTRSVTNPAYLTATTTASGGAIFPCTLGFRLFEGNDDNSIKGTSNHSYWSITDKTDTFSDEFEASTLLKRYTVYPTVDMGLGFEMIANPSAEVELGATPITLDVENVSETTAKVWGRIEGHELLDGTTTFGLGYEEVGGAGTVSYDASSIDANGAFSVEFMALKPNTTYKYFAYLTIDGETYYGEDKEFTTKKGTDETNYEPYFVRNDSVFIIYYDDKKEERNGTFDNDYIYFYDWSSEHNQQFNCVAGGNFISKIIFDPSFKNYRPVYVSFMGCSNLKVIEGLENINTIDTKKISFLGCKSLTSLNLSNFNTSKITDMSEMFRGCNSLESLDLSSFETSNVTNMVCMFAYCSSLKNLNISSFNTSNVTDMTSMFWNCKSITNLDLHHFATNNVTSMVGMFCDCNSLSIINLSNFNTYNVAYMSSMFKGCSSLNCIDISSFNIASISNKSDGLIGMFEGCHSLSTIYSNSSWDNNQLTWVSMFLGCNKLTGGKGTKMGNNYYYDANGQQKSYYCYDRSEFAHIDGGKDNPGLFTAK